MSTMDVVNFAFRSLRVAIQDHLKEGGYATKEQMDSFEQPQNFVYTCSLIVTPLILNRRRGRM